MEGLGIVGWTRREGPRVREAGREGGSAGGHQGGKREAARMERDRDAKPTGR